METLTPFMDLLLFDAWIGNGDRHPGNWSVVISPNRPTRLAPLYDPAGCLAAELLDDSPLLRAPSETSSPGMREDYDRRLKRYVEKCPSGFGDGARLCRMVDVVKEAAETREWQTRSGGWLRCIRRAMQPIHAFIDGLDEDWLPPARKALAKRLLVERLRWLEDRCDATNLR